MRTSNNEEWAQISMVISEKQRNSKKQEKKHKQWQGKNEKQKKQEQ